MALETQGSGDGLAAELNPNDVQCKDNDNVGSQEAPELQEEQEQEEWEAQINDDLLTILTVTMDCLDLKN